MLVILFEYFFTNPLYRNSPFASLNPAPKLFANLHYIPNTKEGPTTLRQRDRELFHTCTNQVSQGVEIYTTKVRTATAMFTTLP